MTAWAEFGWLLAICAAVLLLITIPVRKDTKAASQLFTIALICAWSAVVIEIVALFFQQP